MIFIVSDSFKIMMLKKAQNLWFLSFSFDFIQKQFLQKLKSFATSFFFEMFSNGSLFVFTLWSFGFCFHFHLSFQDLVKTYFPHVSGSSALVSSSNSSVSAYFIETFLPYPHILSSFSAFMIESSLNLFWDDNHSLAS